MIYRDNIVNTARLTLGARWIHQGRCPKTGMDCLGVLIYVGNKIGYFDKFNYTGYKREPDGILLLEELRRYLTEIHVTELGKGDVAVIKFPWNTLPRHVGIIGYSNKELSIIHSLRDKTIGKVVEQPFRRWRPYTCNAFRFNGLRDI